MTTLTSPPVVVRQRLRRPTVIGLLVVWVITRAYMVLQFGMFRGAEVNFQDLNVFSDWANHIVQTHVLPTEATWQYPPGALLAFLPPLLSPNYFVAFIVLLLLADLGILVAIMALASREGRSIGAWAWVLALPAFGSLPLLRFDLIPTVIAVVALCLPSSKRRFAIFGALVGLGITVKAWPILVMLSITGRRPLLRSAVAAAAVVALTVAVFSLLFGNSLGFLFNQSGRGLEIEAVAASPWYFVQAVTGHAVPSVGRNGSLEVDSDTANAVAEGLRVLTAVAGVAIAVWWYWWARRAVGTESQRTVLGRDAAYTAVLIFVVINPVLSPQYLIWVLGLGAVALTSAATSVRRSVVMVLVAILINQALFATWGDLVGGGPNGAYLLCIRNVVLVLAAADAIRSVWLRSHVSVNPVRRSDSASV